MNPGTVVEVDGVTYYVLPEGSEYDGTIAAGDVPAGTVLIADGAPEGSGKRVVEAPKSASTTGATKAGTAGSRAPASISEARGAR